MQKDRTSFFIPAPQPQTPHLTLHNLSTYHLTTEDYKLLDEGLSFSPTSNTPPTDAQLTILKSFNTFAKSLRLRYMRTTHSSNRPHQDKINPTTSSYLYRNMTFLPKQVRSSRLERFTDVGKLENYIAHTKEILADNLPLICNNKIPNLPPTQLSALHKLRHTRHSLTIKPADKNLGIVLMNTDDYITQCMAHLSDTTTYRLSTSYPKHNIKRELQNTVTSFREHIQPLNKRLYTFLIDGHSHPRIPQFYGIPKIHKKFTTLPPMRPIVSQSSSILSPTAQFIDHVLQPLARSYPDYVHNSTALSLILQDLSVPDHAILVTVDVASLYPSIPQSECLQTIHTEMHNHQHLFTFDPNLITRLLHLNINYNYFEFANYTFQQIQGTAMGAAFSPTIANIFMSTVIRAFLVTQTTKPLILTRYIDDIFLIWTGTTEQLTTFLKDLNSFHSSLHFTHESSATSINFLDLTIYKGTNFAYTNFLDTKTFQKPLNLYQYLHFSSAHPNNIYKSIIRGECIRYARTNTTLETYSITLHNFRQRLTKRGYPTIFIDKVSKTVKYAQRQTFLQNNNPRQVTCFPPLFKCLPPPQYKFLKQIILQDYGKLQFISPRFISLRHPTLRHTLVRAHLKPTDEQFIDIALSLNTTPSTHTESAKLPKQKNNVPRITACHHSHCVTCRYHLLLTSTFHSTHPKHQTIYHIRYPLTCTSTNVIYLITCTKCNKQYVGCTTQQLNTRINHHRTNIVNRARIHISQHFNLPGHSLNQHLKVQPIHSANNAAHKIQELYRLE